MAKPTKSSLEALHQVCRYIKGQTTLGITGPLYTTHNEFLFYTDSDHAGDRGLGTRSHTGVVIMCNGVPVQWRSKKQPVTSISSAAAEIYALAEGVKDSRLNAWKAQEMGLERPKPIEIQVDNAAGIVFQMQLDAKVMLKLNPAALQWNASDKFVSGSIQ